MLNLTDEDISYNNVIKPVLDKRYVVCHGCDAPRQLKLSSFEGLQRGASTTFVARFESITTREDYEKFVGFYGVRRTNSEFWTVSDWFQNRLRNGH